MTSPLNPARVKRPLLWQADVNAGGVGTESSLRHEEVPPVSWRALAEKLEPFDDHEDARLTADGESGGPSLQYHRKPRVIVAWIEAEVVDQATATFRVVN